MIGKCSLSSQSAHSSFVPRFLCLLFCLYKASALFSRPPFPMVIILPYIFFLTYFFTVFPFADFFLLLFPQFSRSNSTSQLACNYYVKQTRDGRTIIKGFLCGCLKIIKQHLDTQMCISLHLLVLPRVK